MSNKTVIIVTHAKDNPDKATIGFTLTNASLERGNNTILVLMSEGVRLSIKGYADDINEGEPFKPLKELMAGLISNPNGSLFVCKPCFVKRKLSESQVVDGSKFVTGADVVKLLEDGYSAVTL